MCEQNRSGSEDRDVEQDDGFGFRIGGLTEVVDVSVRPDAADDIQTAELYDPGNRIWTTAGQLNFPRNSHTATLLPNGKVLVAGGWSFLGALAAVAEIYEPANGTWSLAGQLNEARSYHTATLLGNGRLLIAGGFGDSEALASTEFCVEAAPLLLTNPTILPDGAFQFGVTNIPSAGFTVLVSTNPSLPLSNWITLGTVSVFFPGLYEFTDPQATNHPQLFYRIRSN